MSSYWDVRDGHSPVVATAIHTGHDMRPEIAELSALTAAQRFTEEDAHTDGWVDIAGTQVVVHRSRFEVDLNRPRESCVYVAPEDAWGLELWRTPIADEAVEASQRLHDEFYAMLERLLRRVEQEFGRFALYDLHSYNHRRGGPDAPPDDPSANPEINVGTGTMDRHRWSHVVERFIADLRDHDVDGRPLDVRENIRFEGGYLPRWVHETFPHSGCALAIEVKKTYMDEHSGELYPAIHKQIREALAETVPGVREELRRR